jgi:hypothetical protein
MPLRSEARYSCAHNTAQHSTAQCGFNPAQQFPTYVPAAWCAVPLPFALLLLLVAGRWAGREVAIKCIEHDADTSKAVDNEVCSHKALTNTI